MKEQEIKLWLRQKIASLAQINLENVTDDEPFATFGVDSLAAVELMGEAEKLLKTPLAPTLPWDYPTVSQMAKFLETVSNKRTG